MGSRTHGHDPAVGCARVAPVRRAAVEGRRGVEVDVVRRGERLALHRESCGAAGQRVWRRKLRLRSSVGLDPAGFRLASDVRVEGAGGDLAYVRGLVEETASHSLGSLLAGALTVGAGYSGGTLPVQRLFYLGGLQTIRGQTALTASGNAFWMGRAELGTSNPASRVIAFGGPRLGGRPHGVENAGTPPVGCWSRLVAARRARATRSRARSLSVA